MKIVTPQRISMRILDIINFITRSIWIIIRCLVYYNKIKTGLIQIPWRKFIPSDLYFQLLFILYHLPTGHHKLPLRWIWKDLRSHKRHTSVLFKGVFPQDWFCRWSKQLGCYWFEYEAADQLWLISYCISTEHGSSDAYLFALYQFHSWEKSIYQSIYKLYFI